MTLRVFVAVFLVLTLALAGCGGGGGDGGGGGGNGGNGDDEPGDGPEGGGRPQIVAGEVRVPGGVISEETFRAFLRASGFAAQGSSQACDKARNASANAVWDLLADPTQQPATRVPVPAVTPRSSSPPDFESIRKLVIEECDRR